MNTKKIIVILGPTASGKSSLAIELARKYDGEIISADSRQVYKGLDIGTGKVTKREMRGIPHHLLDVENPQHTFSVAQYKNLAQLAIEKIKAKGKLPIIVGGTGFYIEAVVDNILLPEAPPNDILRRKLLKKSLIELQKILKKLDRRRYKTIDLKNPRRIIRAIEIATHLGHVPVIKKKKRNKNFLQIGINTPDGVLRKKITKRLIARIKGGMIEEAMKLHKNGLSWRRMEELGLEYRYLSYYLQDKMTKNEMVKKLDTEIWHYAQRQKTWFRRDRRIKWFGLEERRRIREEVRKFLL